MGRWGVIWYVQQQGLLSMCGSQALSEPAVEKSSLILLGDLSYLFFFAFEGWLSIFIVFFSLACILRPHCRLISEEKQEYTVS